MQTKIAFCLLLAIISAQSQPVLSPAIEPVVVTNRDVFKETVSVRQPVEKNPRWIEVRGEVLESSSNLVVVRTFTVKKIYGPVSPRTFPGVENSSNPLHTVPPLREVVGEKKKYGETIAVRNFSQRNSVANRQTIYCRAFAAGTYDWRGSLIALYEGADAEKSRP